MTSTPGDDPIDVAALRADEQLVEDLRAGTVRDGDDLEAALAAWRDQTR